jgi:predicted AlkP superfamily pyrophosphatase or phosphodiesterase
MGSPRKQAARAIFFAVLVCGLAFISQAQSIAPVITVDHGPNAPSQLSKPYVILVSLDGLRYDYPQLYHAQNLLALAASGATAAEGMIPSYPTVTFPNHYSIITGLYPEHHGIVANRFYDPTRKEVYDFHDLKSVHDGTWYGGTPLWVLAEQQGMRSASFFWVASETEIQGMRPTYYLNYDDSFPNEKRIDQVLAWLRLPPQQRPHFITLYFADADHAGHEHGPDSPQVAAAVSELDKEIGRLVSGLKQLNLPVDVIVVADHGMAKVRDGSVLLDQLGLKTSSFEKIVEPFLYPKSDGDAQIAYESLRGKSDRFEVYRRAQMPSRFHFDSNPRAGDPIIVATGPYYIRANQDPMKPQAPLPGNHGYDTARVPEMKALFVAAGPDIRPGSMLPSFENVDIYPLIANILGLDITHLKTGPIDGKLDVLRSILKAPSQAPPQAK